MRGRSVNHVDQVSPCRQPDPHVAPCSLTAPVDRFLPAFRLCAVYIPRDEHSVSSYVLHVVHGFYCAIMVLLSGLDSLRYVTFFNGNALADYSVLFFLVIVLCYRILLTTHLAVANWRMRKVRLFVRLWKECRDEVASITRGDIIPAYYTRLSRISWLLLAITILLTVLVWTILVYFIGIRDNMLFYPMVPFYEHTIKKSEALQLGSAIIVASILISQFCLSWLIWCLLVVVAFILCQEFMITYDLLERFATVKCVMGDAKRPEIQNGAISLDRGKSPAPTQMTTTVPLETDPREPTESSEVYDDDTRREPARETGVARRRIDISSCRLHFEKLCSLVEAVDEILSIHIGAMLIWAMLGMALSLYTLTRSHAGTAAMTFTILLQVTLSFVFILIVLLLGVWINDKVGIGILCI